MEYVKLGDIVDIKTGKLNANEGVEGGKYPFFTCSVKPLAIDTYSYDCECVLVAGNGDLNVKYYNGKFDAYQRTYIIESKDKLKLDNKYLYYFLSKYVEVLRNDAIGGVIKYIKLNNLTDAILPLPTLDKQYKIVEVLDKAQELIDKRKEQIEELDELVKSRFIEMFGDVILNPNGYNKISISELCSSILGGGTPSKSHPEYYGGNIPWVTPKDMKTQVISQSQIYINEIGVNNSSVKIVPKNSLLMVIRSGILKRTLPIGINDIDVTINQDMKAFVLKENINIYYFYYAIKSIEKDLLTNVRGVTADNIEFSIIRDYKITVPNIDEQIEFADFVKQVEKLKSQMETSLKELEDNFNSLMQKAFKGELF